MCVGRGCRQRDPGVDEAVGRSAADAARKKVEADQSIDLELPPFQLRKQVRAARDEHGARAELRGHRRSLARGLRPEVLESGKTEHQASVPIPASPDFPTSGEAGGGSTWIGGG